MRQGTVYGYSARMRFDLVVNTFLKDAMLYRKLFLHGGGWQWRPLVDVRDVAAAHVAVLDAPREQVHGEIFNLMQENYQVRQLAMLVAGSLGLLGHRVELVDAPLPPIVRDYRMSNVKMTQALGFTPQITVLESIDDMLKRLPLERYADFAHPRHYNIAWMTLLEAVHASQRDFGFDLGAKPSTHDRRQRSQPGSTFGLYRDRPAARRDVLHVDGAFPVGERALGERELLVCDRRRQRDPQAGARDAHLPQARVTPRPVIAGYASGCCRARRP